MTTYVSEAMIFDKHVLGNQGKSSGYGENLQGVQRTLTQVLGFWCKKSLNSDPLGMFCLIILQTESLSKICMTLPKLVNVAINVDTFPLCRNVSVTRLLHQA